MLPALLLTSALLSLGCANEDLIARYTRESDTQQRANCVCPTNGTTERCIEEVELRYPSAQAQECQRRVVAMYPDMRDAVACIADALHEFRPCFDEALRDCATRDDATCGPDFTARTNDCPRPSPGAGEALNRCLR